MPEKYQPDYVDLRHVRTRRVHIFTLIQLTCLGLLWLIKSIKSISILFPIMVLALVGARKLMDYIFTQRELSYLDDVMPEIVKKEIEERKNSATDEDNADGTNASAASDVRIRFEDQKVTPDDFGFPSSINISFRCPCRTNRRRAESIFPKKSAKPTCGNRSPKAKTKRATRRTRNRRRAVRRSRNGPSIDFLISSVEFASFL